MPVILQSWGITIPSPNTELCSLIFDIAEEQDIDVYIVPSFLIIEGLPDQLYETLRKISEVFTISIQKF